MPHWPVAEAVLEVSLGHEAPPEGAALVAAVAGRVGRPVGSREVQAAARHVGGALTAGRGSLVWLVVCGPACDPAVLRACVDGSRLRGARRAYAPVAAGDGTRTWPLLARPVRVGHRQVWGGTSPVWAGGCAALDPRGGGGETLAVAYLMGTEVAAEVAGAELGADVSAGTLRVAAASAWRDGHRRVAATGDAAGPGGGRDAADGPGGVLVATGRVEEPGAAVVALGCVAGVGVVAATWPASPVPVAPGLGAAARTAAGLAEVWGMDPRLARRWLEVAVGSLGTDAPRW